MKGDDDAIPLGDAAIALAFLRLWDAGPWQLSAIDPETKKIETKLFIRSEEQEVLAWIEFWNGKRNLYFGANRVRVTVVTVKSKATKGDITYIITLHVDVDPRRVPLGANPVQHLKDEQQRIKELFELFEPRPTVVIFSGGGYQGFWKLRVPLEATEEVVARVEATNKMLEEKLGGDRCHNVDRIMRLPGTVNIPTAKKRAAGRIEVVAELAAQTDWDLLYPIEDFVDEVEDHEQKPKASSTTTFPLSELPGWVDRLIENGPDADGPHSYDGDRSDAVFAVCCAMVRCGWTDEEIAECLLNKQNRISEHIYDQNNPPNYARRQAARARAEVAQEEAAQAGAAHGDVQREWPAPLEEAAYYGLPGRIVGAIEPHSEADPVAVLAQTLAAFGNLIGRDPYFQVEGDEHHTNLFFDLVGETAKARKGTSWGRVRTLFYELQKDWVIDRVQSGLSSGEGLIWAVRDPITRSEADSETGEVKDIVLDPGIDDKRLMIVELEFAAALRVMGRAGNSLSQNIRDAWDRGNIRSMTKNSPAKTTGAHISIVGHSTVEELRRYLDVTEVANGFANRFIFLCVRRSKILPFGGDQAAIRDAMNGLLPRLKAMVDHARNTEHDGYPIKRGEVTWDRDARSLWAEVYGELSDGKPGMLGAITARAEAQVTRLALIYALMDGGESIGRPHLEAALALWRYAAASAKFIFGDALGDPTADTILRALRAAGAAGMTRSQIASLFGRHCPVADLNRALGLLARLGLAREEQQPSTGGRAATLWLAVR